MKSSGCFSSEIIHTTTRTFPILSQTFSETFGLPKSKDKEPESSTFCVRIQRSHKGMGEYISHSLVWKFREF